MTAEGPGSGWGPGGRRGLQDGRDPEGDGSPETDGERVAGDASSGASEQDGAPPPRLAPLAMGSLFEVAARIIRRHARPLLAVSALFQFPSSLVDAAAQQRLGHALAPIIVGLDSDTPRILEPTAGQSQAILEALLVVVGTSLLGALLGAIATLAFTTAVLDDYRGRVPAARGMVRVAIGRAVPALLAGLLAGLALLGVIVGAAVAAVVALTVLPASDAGEGGVGAFLAILIGVSALVLAVLAIVRLALPAAVIAGESVGALPALRRSWHLTGGHTWRAFAVLGTVALVTTILGSTLLELSAAVVTDGFAAGAGLGDLSDAFLSALVSTLLAPIGGVVLAVLYLDLRVRRDGWQPEPDPPAPRVGA